MIRHSFSISFVPNEEKVGVYVFYVTMTECVDGTFTKSETIHQKECVGVPESDMCVTPLNWAAEMTDRGWQEIIHEVTQRANAASA